MFVRYLGVRKNSVEAAIKHPDDYQHLMTEYAPEESKDTLSLFVKEIKTVRKGNNHWLLVQTIRRGLTQIVQSSWRIFPDVVDLSSAYEPVHLLKAFVKVFGLPVQIEGRTVLFIESEEHRVGTPIKWGFEGMKEVGFASLSTATSAESGMFQIGMAYSIDIPKYREMLAKRGVV